MQMKTAAAERVYHQQIARGCVLSQLLRSSLALNSRHCNEQHLLQEAGSIHSVDDVCYQTQTPCYRLDGATHDWASTSESSLSLDHSDMASRLGTTAESLCDRDAQISADVPVDSTDRQLVMMQLVRDAVFERVFTSCQSVAPSCCVFVVSHQDTSPQYSAGHSQTGVLVPPPLPPKPTHLPLTGTVRVAATSACHQAPATGRPWHTLSGSYSQAVTCDVPVLNGSTGLTAAHQCSVSPAGGQAMVETTVNCNQLVGTCSADTDHPLVNTGSIQTCSGSAHLHGGLSPCHADNDCDTRVTSVCDSSRHCQHECDDVSNAALLNGANGHKQDINREDISTVTATGVERLYSCVKKKSPKSFTVTSSHVQESLASATLSPSVTPASLCAAVESQVQQLTSVVTLASSVDTNASSVVNVTTQCLLSSQLSVSQTNIGSSLSSHQPDYEEVSDADRLCLKSYRHSQLVTRRGNVSTAAQCDSYRQLRKGHLLLVSQNSAAQPGHSSSTVVAYDKHGTTFYVPGKYLRLYGDPAGEPWFFPVPLTPLQATVLLSASQTEGCFIVYEPTADESDVLYRLSVCRGPDVLHYNIETRPDGTLALAHHGHVFLCLADLVNYLQQNRSSLGTRLLRPLAHLHLPLDFVASLELSRSQLSLSGNIIGHGHSAVICAGVYQAQPVAVKVLHGHSAQDEMMLLNEARCLMRLAGQPAIIHLVGVLTQSRPQYIVTELASHGSLKQCLRSGLFTGDSANATISNLLSLSLQAMSALCYLESEHYMLHRDVATRNFLVTQQLQLKLADFSRATYVIDDLYRADQSELICVKWAAPEVLMTSSYSTRSDVWSAGVSLWEIWSAGERPYRSLSGEQTAVYVVNGGRLARPVLCPSSIYTAMRACWLHRPLDRAPASHVMHMLSQLDLDDWSGTGKCDVTDDQQLTSSSSSSATSSGVVGSNEELISRDKLRASLRKLMSLARQPSHS